MRDISRASEPRRGKAALAAAALAAALLAVACGSEKNPILGTWDVSLKTGDHAMDAAVGIVTSVAKPYVIFSETTMEFHFPGLSEASRPVNYIHDKDSGWSVCFGEESGQCQRFSFQDEQRTRAVFTFLGAELSLIKRPENAAAGG